MPSTAVSALMVISALELTAGAAAAQMPPPPPPTYGPPITLEQAKKVMAGAEAKKNSLSAAIIILDSGQHGDDAEDGRRPPGSVDAARDKAYSAVAFRRRRPSRTLSRRAARISGGCA
jgi:uncharacterized protein GlcG (DUF336 family)